MLFLFYFAAFSEGPPFPFKPVKMSTVERPRACESNTTRVIFEAPQPALETEGVAAVTRGKLSNCSLSDIKKKPGVVMLTATNLAFLDISLNMLESVKRVGVCVNTTIMAEDQTTFDVLRMLAKDDPAIHVQKTFLKELGTEEPSRRNYSEYYGYMNRRQAYFFSLLEQGLEVLFTDSDTFWYRDPFPYFQGDFDMCLRGRTPTRMIKKTLFNAGFMYMKPTSATINFVRTWMQVMEGNMKKGSYKKCDQSIMNALLKRNKPRVNIKVLHPDLFPLGPTFLNPDWQNAKHDTVVYHAAGIQDHDPKIAIFKEYGIWLLNRTSSS